MQVCLDGPVHVGAGKQTPKRDFEVVVWIDRMHPHTSYTVK